MTGAGPAPPPAPSPVDPDRCKGLENSTRAGQHPAVATSANSGRVPWARCRFWPRAPLPPARRRLPRPPSPPVPWPDCATARPAARRPLPGPGLGEASPWPPPGVRVHWQAGPSGPPPDGPPPGLPGAWPPPGRCPDPGPRLQGPRSIGARCPTASGSAGVRGLKKSAG